MTRSLINLPTFSCTWKVHYALMLDNSHLLKHLTFLRQTSAAAFQKRIGKTKQSQRGTRSEEAHREHSVRKHFDTTLICKLSTTLINSPATSEKGLEKVTKQRQIRGWSLLRGKPASYRSGLQRRRSEKEQLSKKSSPSAANTGRRNQVLQFIKRPSDSLSHFNFPRMNIQDSYEDLELRL